MEDHQFNTGNRLTLGDVAEGSGIHRTTLSKIANTRGYNTTSDNLNALCKFFECRIEDIAEYVDVEE